MILTMNGPYSSEVQNTLLASCVDQDLAMSRPLASKAPLVPSYFSVSDSGTSALLPTAPKRAAFGR